jgi:ATP-dependent helicase/nuclease subunit A
MRPLPELQPEQRDASDPASQVWLSASAGTGKTQVLVARVLRLLLRPAVDPSAILCLTFTKAGAAEMSNRLSKRLAYWVRLDDTLLFNELEALGEDAGPAARTRARGLFARVLDARGGGLRIQTIHSFAQALLASFPLEAELAPGMRQLEGREEAALARQVLAELVTRAAGEGRRALIANLQALSRRLGEEGAESFLRDCARAPEALEQLGPDIPDFVRKALELPTGDIDAHIADQCGDALFDLAGLSSLAAHNAAWGTPRGLTRADGIARWQALSAGERSMALDDLYRALSNSKGEPQLAKGWAPAIDGYAELATHLHGRCKTLVETRVRARLADLFAAGLEAGRDYARAYAEAKRSAGVVDFDDLIRATVRLLGTPGMGDWIRFKLDQATDHILVDEAQDTNLSQWSIIKALAEEFFAGEGASGSKVRTIFSVGDYKQAIFGFQGTNPKFFADARDYFAEQAGGVQGRVGLKDLSLSRSFRSTEPVLEAVDATVAALAPEALGSGVVTEPHRSAVPGPGLVTLWRPVSAEQAEDDEGEESWVGDAPREFATRLAQRIKGWLAEPMMLKDGPIRPQDIMILVRKRGDLAALIVARLYAEGVPVAGLDRLRLNAPLAVRDLLAAARFALQPEDDLSLASLLVSPLIGWSQDELLAHALRPSGRRLWRHLRERPDQRVGEAVALLTDLLNTADFTTPYQFFERILSGAMAGRCKLLGRLGEEARDPVEELLSAALAFERQATPSLQRFLDWFDRGDVDIVRDPSQPLDAVRVMTAHGAKGLQAPVVILADAATDPGANRRNRLDWRAPGLDQPLPLFRPRKDELAGSLAHDLADAERKDREEHWRLLYVAMTRAEERLYVGGALGTRAKGVPPPDSWYAAIAKGLECLGAEPLEDGRLEWAGRAPHLGVAAKPREAKRSEARLPLPAWARAPAPKEARPPRPLAPSSIGTDEAADPPPGPAMRAAAERGRLLHALFERLPAVPPEQRRAAAEHWLSASGGVGDPMVRQELAAQVCGVIGDPRFAELFSPGALPEVPIAAVVDGQVIAGKVDRLHVSEDRVLVVDFKTNRRPPADLARAPESHLQQMAAYAAALGVIFPGRRIEAALLYSSGPVLLPLDVETLQRFKPRLAAA